MDINIYGISSVLIFVFMWEPYLSCLSFIILPPPLLKPEHIRIHGTFLHKPVMWTYANHLSLLENHNPVSYSGRRKPV